MEDTRYPAAYGWLASAVDSYLRGYIDKETLRKRLRAAELSITAREEVEDIADRIDAAP